MIRKKLLDTDNRHDRELGRAGAIFKAGNRSQEQTNIAMVLTLAGTQFHFGRWRCRLFGYSSRYGDCG